MPAIIGEMITIIIMAFALGMDAFSISLGMGMYKLRLRQIFKIGITIGVFHIVMPLLGMITGRFLSEQFGTIAAYIGGGLMLLLGLQMIWSSFSKEEGSLMTPVGMGLFLFALSVSLDSFSVGLTLGIYGAKTFSCSDMLWSRRNHSFLAGAYDWTKGSKLAWKIQRSLRRIHFVVIWD